MIDFAHCIGKFHLASPRAIISHITHAINAIMLLPQFAVYVCMHIMS